jgi:hypothetical protein
VGRGHLQWHDLSTEFHKDLLTGSKVIRDTHRQRGDFIGLTSVSKESRLRRRPPLFIFLLMLPYILAHIMCRPTYLFNYTDQIKEYVPYKGNIFLYLFVCSYLTTLFSVTQTTQRRMKG